jgi:putative transposase
MKKLNIGYAKYFNQKYERTGTLFEGRFKSVLIKEHSHFIHLPYYIHLNPLDLISSEWRMKKIKDYKKAIDFLDSYRWSSHLDYTGQSNFPSVTQRDFLLEIFGDEGQYKKLIENWLADCKEVRINDIALE